MKFTAVQLKQIIKEELSKIISEVDGSQKTPEEKALSIDQQNALKRAVDKIEKSKKLGEDLVNYLATSEQAPQTADYRIEAEYLKKDQATGKPRHVKGAIMDFSGGLPFEINYDPSTKQFVIEIHGLSIESDEQNLTRSFRKIANDALTALKKEGGEFDKNVTSGPSKTKSYSSSDYEGGSKKPSASTREIWGTGSDKDQWVALPTLKGGKWGGRW